MAHKTNVLTWLFARRVPLSRLPGLQLNNAGGSAVFEIQKSGVDINKLVIGKPGSLNDVGEAQRSIGGGFMDPATLGTCVQQAVSQGWKAGVMSFQVSSGDARLREDMRSDGRRSSQAAIPPGFLPLRATPSHEQTARG